MCKLRRVARGHDVQYTALTRGTCIALSCRDTHWRQWVLPSASRSSSATAATASAQCLCEFSDSRFVSLMQYSHEWTRKSRERTRVRRAGGHWSSRCSSVARRLSSRPRGARHERRPMASSSSAYAAAAFQLPAAEPLLQDALCVVDNYYSLLITH